MDLGAPIGTHTSTSFDNTPNPGLTGLTGNSGSTGVTGTGSTPIADRFTSGNTSSGDAVSGQYAGGGVRDALTGESHAQRTGAGVGPLGENLGSGAAGTGLTSGSEHHHHHHHHHHDQGANTHGLGQANEQNSSSNYTSTAPLTKETRDSAAGYGTGVGAQGGAGGHYSRDDEHRGQGTGAGAGAGAAGLAAGAGAIYGGDKLYDSENRGSSTTNNNQNREHSGEIGKPGQGSDLNPTAGSGGAGKYGRADESDFDRGAPLSNPKDIDTGGPHSLVLVDGKYVHRRDL